MKVKRNTLLLLACLVWGAAGFNILRIGLIAYPSYRSVLNVLLSVLVFVVFQKFIFGKLVKKHTARIRSYIEERHFFLKFFDGKIKPKPDYPLKTLYPRAFQTGLNRLIYYDFTTVE